MNQDKIKTIKDHLINFYTLDRANANPKLFSDMIENYCLKLSQIAEDEFFSEEVQSLIRERLGWVLEKSNG